APPVFRARNSAQATARHRSMRDGLLHRTEIRLLQASEEARSPRVFLLAAAAAARRPEREPILSLRALRPPPKESCKRSATQKVFPSTMLRITTVHITRPRPRIRLLQE